MIFQCQQVALPVVWYGGAMKVADGRWYFSATKVPSDLKYFGALDRDNGMGYTYDSFCAVSV